MEIKMTERMTEWLTLDELAVRLQRGVAVPGWDGRALLAEAVEAGLVGTPTERVLDHGSGATGNAVGAVQTVLQVEVPTDLSDLCATLAAHIRAKYAPKPDASTEPAPQVIEEEPEARPGPLSRAVAAVGKVLGSA
jgi:hypothetical protein